MTPSNECLSHNLEDRGAEICQTIKQRLTDPEAIDLLNQLNAFDLGRFLIQHGGLNGFWTSYVVNKGDTPLLKHHTSQASKPPLEDWLLNDCPSFQATQQRFALFQKVLQRLVHPGYRMASVPCGVMDDFFTLDYAEAPDIKLTGIDIDPQSLELAEENAMLHGLQDRTTFLSNDAWTFGEPDSFDVLTSSGLNIYEPDDERTVALYKNFHRVLKPGSYLVTSFLTPPPRGDKPSPWKDLKLNDLLKQKILFRDILNVKWQVFFTEVEFRAILKKAGFTVCDILYDQHRLFPTVLAQKQ
jgi:ubiquinone/menaquinone biosynthesis C-methylase UbiE